MDTALPQKFPFILDRNLAKANCTGNQVCTSCDTPLENTLIQEYLFLIKLKATIMFYTKVNLCKSYAYHSYCPK